MALHQDSAEARPKVPQKQHGGIASPEHTLTAPSYPLEMVDRATERRFGSQIKNIAVEIYRHEKATDIFTRGVSGLIWTTDPQSLANPMRIRLSMTI